MAGYVSTTTEATGIITKGVRRVGSGSDFPVLAGPVDVGLIARRPWFGGVGVGSVERIGVLRALPDRSIDVKVRREAA
jgi:hypothetical protein